MYYSKEWLIEQLMTGVSQREIAKKAGVHVGTIEKYIHVHGLTGYKELHFYSTCKEKMSVENPEFCYLLGLFVTDGNFDPSTGRVSISSKDKQPLKFLGEHFNAKVYSFANSSYNLVFPKAAAFDIFTSLGFIPGEKTFSVSVPEVPSNLKYLVIRGMVDGDGSIARYNNARKIKYFSCSPSLVSYFCDFITSLGYKYSKHKHAKGEQVEVSEKDTLAACLDIYSGHPKLAIPRKLAIVQNQVDDIVRTYEMINRKSMELNASWITN